MKGKSESEVTQLCPTLSDLMDCSPPGSSVHGIFQARVLEWLAIAFSMTNLDSILKMSTLTKLIHRFNTIVNKMPGRLFVNIGKLVLNCI